MIDLYDFDKTIYKNDSTIDFYKFSLIHRPKIIKYLPKQVLAIIKYKLKFISKREMKETFFIFLRDIPNLNDYINSFWRKNIKKIKVWYQNKDHRHDIIISASPEFLLLPMKDILKVKDILATKVNKNTGKFESENCYGEEKVRRLKEKYPNIKIHRAYSDSLSDMPMLSLAQKKYIVKRNEITTLN